MSSEGSAVSVRFVREFVRHDRLFDLAETPIHKERKRRDFLCERRSRSRGMGGDWSTTTGASSIGGRSNSLTSARSRSSSVRERMDHSVASGMTGGGDSRGELEEDEQEEGDGDGDGQEPFSSVEFPIARRVNARRPSTTATGAAASSKQHHENVVTSTTSSSSFVSYASCGEHQPRVSQSTPSMGRSWTSAKEGFATKDVLPTAQAQSTGARETTTKRPRTSGHIVDAIPGGPSSRCISPLLVGDGAVVGSSPSVTMTATTAAAAAPASTVGGEGRRATINYPQHRHRHSSLSFAQNPHATTAEMIRRYRGELRRSSWSSQQPRRRLTGTFTTMPPLLSGGRRRSDGSTPWHYYVSMNKTAGSGPASRPLTSIGGSRWSQDVRLQQHIRGRSRLAPATRTAGGRWGANHGRLEALVPGDESDSSTTSITYRIRREGGPWVLDAEPSIGSIL